MIVEVQVPNQGLTITEATLLQWRKCPGDSVVKGDILFEIETDKATQEIESPASGTLLTILGAPGDVVPLGKTVATIGTEAADCGAVGVVATESGKEGRSDGSASVPPTREQGPMLGGITGAGRPCGDTVVSPRAQRAAARLGVDLSMVRPTGGRGLHIRESDILRAAEARHTQPSAADASESSPIPPKPARAARFRVLTAERTSASFRDTPHFYLTREILVDRLVSLRGEMAADLEAQIGIRVSITDFLLKALALALQAFPDVNAQWNGSDAVPLPGIDIGLAIETPEGVAAPILSNPGISSLVAIAKARLDLVRRAREGDLHIEEFTGGSFTLSNLGGFGVDQFEAIIVPPQSGILATGAIKKRPFVVEDQLRVCHTLFLTLSMDHRVVDGAAAARFLDHIATLLEKPTILCAQ